MRRKKIADQVVVVMGASSGIGRLTALELARRGARVVVAARGGEALDSLVAQIQDAGWKAIAVPADTSDFAQVEVVATTAERELGGLDTWIQMAAVSVYAPMESTKPEEFKQVIDVGLIGQAYGALAAIPVMRRHGGGHLIHVSSIEAEVSMPFHSAYAAAKHGVAGMLDSLRLELRKERAPIALTNVMPASIDTPFFDHARTKIGVKPRGLPPVYDPQDVADAIVRAVERPRREVIVGGAGQVMVRMQRHFPRLVEAMLLRSAFRGQMTRQQKRVSGGDSLTTSQNDDRIRGEEGPSGLRAWRRRRVRRWVGRAALAAVAVFALSRVVSRASRA
jgi:NAD(P)-dependent dehydrogenase (short-subunit alcohol dehydrogenase family)